jgi:membrane fusion protein (multidrug efflux system)
MSELETVKINEVRGAIPLKKLENDPGNKKETMENQTKAPSGKRKKIIMAIIVVAIAVGSYMGYQSFVYVTTDNAMVMGQATLLSPRVSGVIIKADVQENQKVKAGQLLIEIKADDYQNALNEAQSDRDSMAAQLKGADSNYRRAVELLKQGASTKERFDSAESSFRSMQEKLQSADAKVAQAKLNLDYTKVVAPTDGKIGRKSFEVGMLAAAGQPLLGFVGGNERWVVANLKETDMDHIVEGDKASIEVDAISGKTFEGEVESISPATGATFSLLPPDNASGNFTKVVQRVPVRIKLLNLTDHEIDRLQSGLSADVKIKVR